MRVPVVHQQGRRRRARYARLLWNTAEVVVTLGVVLLLLVVHQLWWTNRQAKEAAERKVQALEQQWEDEGEGQGEGDIEGGREPLVRGSGSSSGFGTGTGTGGGLPGGGGRPRYDQAFAVLGIPRLGLRVPVAEGVGASGVLDKGYVGHYPDTAQPGRVGNFALAGHRNTHGEPFRYLDRLRRGDRVEVETRAAVYTYVVDRTLPRTSPGDGGTIRAIPRSTVRPAYGYTEPAHYLTLTTCTPQYTSTYRLVVWGKLRSVRPR